MFVYINESLNLKNGIIYFLIYNLQKSNVFILFKLKFIEKDYTKNHHH